MEPVPLQMGWCAPEDTSRGSVQPEKLRSDPVYPEPIRAVQLWDRPAQRTVECVALVPRDRPSPSVPEQGIRDRNGS